MFGNTKAFSSFAVPDLRAVRAFYGETLGDASTEPWTSTRGAACGSSATPSSRRTMKRKSGVKEARGQSPSLD
jgi:hypothetical protein